MIKQPSVAIKQNDYANVKKFLAISLAAIMIFGSFSVGFLSGDNFALGAKPTKSGSGKNVIEWSNGAPSGAHHNLIIHGKKLAYDCDNSPGGGSVFVPAYTAEADNNPQTIEFVTNQKSKIENLTATDPCSEHFDGDPIQVQIPYESSGYYVYWSLKGKPDNGRNSDGNVSNFTLAGPNITQFCNVTEASSIVKEGDSDFGDLLKNFTLNIMHEDTGSTPMEFDIGETVYDDIDTSLNVTDGDERLANAGNWTDASEAKPAIDGSFVELAPDDEDVGQDLEPFVNGTEMYRDTDSSLEYSIGEPIYEDSDMSGDVSVGFVKDGSEALSCDDLDLINGAGAITDKKAFKLKNGSLERFDPDNPPQKGKGKNKFVDITGLFQWSGAICNATILANATINTIDDGQITITDFDVDGDLTRDDLVGLGYATDVGDADTTIIDPAETTAQIKEQTEASDGIINTEKEFAAFMEIVFGGPPYNCTAVYDVWVFNLAQIVAVGVDVINDGGITVQVRFYPVATTVVE